MLSTPNYFNWAFQAITELLNANTGLFVSMGQNLFRAFATIVLAWFGIKTALSAGEHWGGVHFSSFASLVLSISFGFAMINYYATPIPGIGTDFHHLITDQAQSLSTTSCDCKCDLPSLQGVAAHLVAFAISRQTRNQLPLNQWVIGSFGM